MSVSACHNSIINIDNPRDIFPCVRLLLEVSIRVCDPKTSDKYRCHW